MEEALKELEQWMENRERSVRTLMGGGGILMRGQEVVKREADKGRSRRQSKDGKVNREERMLVEFIKKRGWSIFNGNINRNEKGEYTFMGGIGRSVIDYIIGDRNVKDRIERMRVGNRIDSDYQPVEVWLRGEIERGKEEGKGGEGVGEEFEMRKGRRH